MADEQQIQCDLCDEFKHTGCYGQMIALKPTIKFVCYSCLLDIEPARLSQMKATCVRRRALYYLDEQPDGTLYSIERLAQYLGTPGLHDPWYLWTSAKIFQIVTKIQQETFSIN
jgi:hypothetical protein